MLYIYKYIYIYKFRQQKILTHKFSLILIANPFIIPLHPSFQTYLGIYAFLSMFTANQVTISAAYHSILLSSQLPPPCPLHSSHHRQNDVSKM